jgi:hypothetical protein
LVAFRRPKQKLRANRRVEGAGFLDGSLKAQAEQRQATTALNL